MKPNLPRIAHVFVTILCIVSFVYAGNESTSITIIHVNDTHSHLDAFGPKDSHLNGTLGGIAGAAAVIAKIRAGQPNAMLLHAGDMSHGDFFFNKYFGVPELQLMQQMGFDAMAVGNHEFDRGPGRLLEELHKAFPQGGFPLLAANLDFTGIPPELLLLQRYIKGAILLNHVPGIKVGIFGMTVPNEPTSSPAPIVVKEDVGSIAATMVADLRSQGARVIVCLSHMGFRYDQAVAAGVPGIDVIIGGHDHFLFEKPQVVTNSVGKQTLILQAGDSYRYVGKLELAVGPAGDVTLMDYSIIPVDRSVSPLAYVQGVVDSLKKGIVAAYGDVFHNVVGIARHDIEKEYDPASSDRDTPLGNLVADACRRRVGTQLAIAANGFIAEKIYAGKIVESDVFRTVSYGFDSTSGLGYRLVKVQLTGADIIVGFETTLSYLGVSDDYFLQVSGMNVTYSGTDSIGRRVKSVYVGKKPIDPVARYSVTVNEGIAQLFTIMGITPSNVEGTKFIEYNVVRDYIKRLGVLNGRPVGRIRDISVHENVEKAAGTM